MFSLLAILAGSGVPKPLRQIVFDAKPISVSKKGIVKPNGDGGLYVYTIDSGKTKLLFRSQQILSNPRFVDFKTVLYVQHDSKSNANELYTYDLELRARRKRGSLPEGSVERLEIYSGGYVFVSYLVPDGKYTDCDPRQIVDLKDYRPYYAPKQLVSDATLDPDGKSILMVKADHSGLTRWSPGQPNATEVPTPTDKRIYYTGGNGKDTFALAIQEDGFDFIHSGTVKSAPMPESKDEDYGPAFFYDPGFDHCYPGWTKFKKDQNQFLLFAHHGMSDGWHALTFSFDPDHSKVESLCMGQYIGPGPNAKMITIYNPWIGPYKRGGARVGRLFLTKRDDLQDAKPLTPQTLDVGDADGI